MRRLLSIMLASLLLALMIGNASAERRVALVIGNAAYRHAAELGNPRNDAADIAAALRSLGIEVVEGIDLDKPAMDRKIREFAQALSGADVAIFFYAGHGLQVNGSNYLVPVDAELLTAAAIDFEMLRLDTVQRIMESEAKTNILFLDACRNNPLSRNLARAMGTRSASVGSGLASAESGIGTLISFSTQPGNVALDGTGRNSPYALALAKQIRTPDKDLSASLITVRNEVMAATRRSQVPWEHSALTASFYFSRSTTITAPASAPPRPEILPSSPTASSVPMPDRQIGDRIAQYIEWEFLLDKERYDARVDYYDKGIVDRDFVARDKQQYAARWPVRTYNLQQGSIQMVTISPQEYSVTFGFTYKLSNGPKRTSGTGRTQVRLRLQNDQFIVSGVKAVVLTAQ